MFPLTGLALALLSAPSIFAGEVLRWSVDWVPALGLDFGFRMDGLAWLFALLILGIGALVVLYAAYYLHHDDPPARFFQFLLLFMGAMLGVVLADNLVLLVVFWEATSLSSFLLIGYWKDRKDAREGARMALAITGAGGLALLGGVLLIGHIVGSVKLDAVLAAGPTIRAHPLYLPALVLVLLGAFTKSAQFPFHFWLPHAMAAPTPVSAYLHSATMVKAGVFLLARLYPALGGSDAVVLDRRADRARHAAARRVLRDLQARPEGPARVFDDQPPGADHAAVRPRLAAGRRRRGLPHPQPRDLQGVALHGRGDHRPRDRVARHAEAERPAGSTCRGPRCSRSSPVRRWPACRC